MISLNKVTLIGNVGTIEDKILSNGNQVVNLSLATSEHWKDKNTGEKKEKTEWHKIVVFGKQAEILSNFVDKGSKLYIEGQLQTRKWQDSEGKDRYSTEIILSGFNSKFILLDSKKSDNQSENNKSFSKPKQQAKIPDNAFDDDIPF